MRVRARRSRYSVMEQNLRKASEKLAATLPAQATGVRTSRSESLANLPARPLTNKTFSATLIPRSVTTFVLNNVTPVTSR